MRRVFRTRRPGISMVEALVAVTVTTIAGAALLTSIGAAVRSSTDAAHLAVARGLAEQMMDKIAAVRFPDDDIQQPSPTTRENFDDIDDYNGWSSSPVQDRNGRALGTEGDAAASGAEFRPTSLRPDTRFLNRLTRRVEVERIRPDPDSGWSIVSEHTNFRRVTVRVDDTNSQSNTKVLADISRVFSLVPVAP